MSEEKNRSNDKRIEELIKNRELMEDLGVLEGDPKREDVKSINEEIKRLKNLEYSSLK